jgi:hypothetical protein
MSEKKCKRCGACQECGQVPYTVYPQTPYPWNIPQTALPYAYWSVIPPNNTTYTYTSDSTSYA